MPSVAVAASEAATHLHSGLRDEGSGYRIWGLGFRDEGLGGFTVWSLGSRDQGVGCGVQNEGWRV